jgi:repressor LexA
LERLKYRAGGFYAAPRQEGKSMKELTQRQREVLTFITNYIKNNAFPPTIRDIAESFSVSVKGAYDHVAALKKKGYVRGYTKRSRTMGVINPGETEDEEDNVKIPLLGTVAAGYPILAEENWDGLITVHRSMLKKNRDYFALKVRGSSMIGAGIMDGDTAVIEKRDTAEDGEIVIAVVNEAITMKRFFRESNRIRLQAENAEYKPIYSQDVHILGRVAHVFRSYQ